MKKKRRIQTAEIKSLRKTLPQDTYMIRSNQNGLLSVRVWEKLIVLNTYNSSVLQSLLKIGYNTI